ncbi:MAG: DnaB-like helicase N-terminal domain-containing protein [Geodermatophilaceae bacterium]
MNDRSRPKAASETPAKKSTASIAPSGDIGSQVRPNLNPEAAYIGALLWLEVDRAGRAAGLVEPGDLADPRLRVVLGLVRDVVADGVRPDPVVVMAHARAAGTVTTTHAIKSLAELLADLYAECPLAASVGYYAAAVLDGSLRRRCALLGERIGQIADSASLAELVRVVGAEVVEVFELRNRRAAVLAGLGMPVLEVAA